MENLERELYEMKEVLGRIEIKLDGVICQANDHEKRIRNLEGKSGIRWETLVGDIIKLCVAAAIGYYIAK